MYADHLPIRPTADMLNADETGVVVHVTWDGTHYVGELCDLGGECPECPTSAQDEGWDAGDPDRWAEDYTWNEPA